MYLWRGPFLRGAVIPFPLLEILMGYVPEGVIYPLPCLNA
jgi:hypothetical protein